MSTDPRDEDLPPLPEPAHITFRDGEHMFSVKQVYDYARPLAAEIARLTAELADEKAVNEHQRSELQDRMKKQRETEAALRCIAEFPASLDDHQPSATDLVLHHWETVCELKRIASEALKEKPHGRTEQRRP